MFWYVGGYKCISVEVIVGVRVQPLVSFRRCPSWVFKHGFSPRPGIHRVGCLASEPWGFACLHLANAAIKSDWHYVCLFFLMGLGIKFTLILVRQVFHWLGPLFTLSQVPLFLVFKNLRLDKVISNILFSSARLRLHESAFNTKFERERVEFSLTALCIIKESDPKPWTQPGSLL